VNLDEAPAALERLVGPAWPEALGSVRHVVTNHRITIEASLVRCSSQAPGLRWASAEELEQLPMPAPQRRILRMAHALV